MNVNHTVDSAEPDDGSEEAPEMKSKPNFEVDIVKTGGKTLSFSCSFAPPPDVQDPQSQSEEAYGKLIWGVIQRLIKVLNICAFSFIIEILLFPMF